MGAACAKRRESDAAPSNAAPAGEPSPSADDTEHPEPKTEETEAEKDDNEDKEKTGPGKRPSDGPRIPKALRSALEGKSYTQALEHITETTALRYSDLDPKALKLLDILQERGKASDACKYLQLTLAGIPREQISNWRAYVYSLVRGLDAEAYAQMKEAGGAADQPKQSRKERPAPKTKEQREEKSKYAVTKTPLRVSAPAFVPGKILHGTPTDDGASKAVAPEAPSEAPADAPTPAEAAAEAQPQTLPQAPDTCGDALAEAVLHELTRPPEPQTTE